MKDKILGLKMFLDLILIITWIVVIAKGLNFNGWLVLISIIFWFSSYGLIKTDKD